MDSAIGSLVIIGASVGSSMAVAKPAAELVKNLLERFLGPSADLGGERLREFIDERTRRGADVLAGAVEILDADGVEPVPVPGRILFPILTNGSLEDNSEMRRRWSALLANAAKLKSGDDLLPGFAEILRQLTPMQANILQFMFEANCEKNSGAVPRWPDCQGANLQFTFKLSAADYVLLVEDMTRLNVIEPRRRIEKGTKGTNVPMDQVLQLAVDTWNSRVKYESIGITTLGSRFMQACTPPGFRKYS